MEIAIIGAGNVGGVLARGWAAAGHDILLGVRAPGDPKYRPVAEAAGGARLMTMGEAVAACAVAVLTVPWDAVPAALAACGDFGGRTLIDPTNPVVFGADGVVLAMGFDRSGGEEVARLARNARVVKALNTVGSGVMDKAKDYPAPPAMYVAGDDDAAKAQTTVLLADLGFAPIDAGGLKIARLLEPMAMVWINQVVNRGADPFGALVFMSPG